MVNTYIHGPAEVSVNGDLLGKFAEAEMTYDMERKRGNGSITLNTDQDKNIFLAINRNAKISIKIFGRGEVVTARINPAPVASGNIGGSSSFSFSVTGSVSRE